MCVCRYLDVVLQLISTSGDNVTDDIWCRAYAHPARTSNISQHTDTHRDTQTRRQAQAHTLIHTHTYTQTHTYIHNMYVCTHTGTTQTHNTSNYTHLHASIVCS